MAKEKLIQTMEDGDDTLRFNEDDDESISSVESDDWTPVIFKVIPAPETCSAKRNSVRHKKERKTNHTNTHLNCDFRKDDYNSDSMDESDDESEENILNREQPSKRKLFTHFSPNKKFSTARITECNKKSKNNGSRLQTPSTHTITPEEKKVTKMKNGMSDSNSDVSGYDSDVSGYDSNASDSLKKFPYQNEQVAKYFDDTIYYGIVTECFISNSETTKYNKLWCWRICFYRDGDIEDWDLEELHIGLSLFRNKPKKTPKCEKRNKLYKVNNDRTAEKQVSAVYDIHEVEEVLGRRTKQMKYPTKSVEYLIKWKDCWLPAESLGPGVLAKAWEKFDDKKQGIATNRSVSEKSDNCDESSIPIDVMNDEMFDSIILQDNININFDYDYDNNEIENGSDSETKRSMQDRVNLLEEIDYEYKWGQAEMVIDENTYKIGDRFKLKDGIIVEIKELYPRQQKTKCISYIACSRTFLGSREGRQRGRATTYCIFGSERLLPVSELTLKYHGEIDIDNDWIYDCNRDKNGKIDDSKSFSYYKKHGKIPESIPGPKPSVLELFSGAGGMSLGFSNAGMQTKYAVETDYDTIATLRCNFPHCDVFEEKVEDFIAHARDGKEGYPSELDVQHIHASPPCQGFSGANRHSDSDDAIRNNEESLQFIKAINHFQPLTATYENVRGLRHEKNHDYLKKVVSGLIEMNYQVRVELLNASDYGDPQNRKRFFIFAAKDHMILPSTPIPTHGDPGSGLLPRRTIKDTIDWLKRNRQPSDRSDIPIMLNGIKVYTHYLTNYSPMDADDKIQDANSPADTILCKPSSHYDGRRTTPLENALLQSFPCHFKFHNSKNAGKLYKQIGNAVPVMLATHVARAVAKVHGLP